MCFVFADGYVFFQGSLDTLGSWTSVVYGCGENKKLGDDYKIRTGGGPYHGGEFLQTKCADYSGPIVSSHW